MIDFQLLSALVTYYFIMFATPGPNNAMLTASGLKVWFCKNFTTFNWDTFGSYFSNRSCVFWFW